MLDAPLAQHFAKLFRLLNGDGAHQHRLAFFVMFRNVINHGLELGRHSLIHHVRTVLPDHRAVGGNFHHVQPVYFGKFLLLCHSGARHAGKLLILAEIVLEGNSGKGFALPRDLHPFLGLNGLVQAFVIPPPEHQAPGKFVNDNHLAIFHHIVLILVHNAPGPDGLVYMVLDADIIRVGQVFNVKIVFRFFHAPAGKGTGFELLIDNIIIFVIQLVIVLLFVSFLHPDRLQGFSQGICPLVKDICFIAMPGNNQGGAGLVNEDGVHLVHNGVMVAPLHFILLADNHIVPQVVKAQLVIGGIGDVAGIRLPLLRAGHAR